jgi:hypothetical protein
MRTAQLQLGMLILLGALPLPAKGDEAQGSAPALEKGVLQLFQSRCCECHASPKLKGKLDLTSFEAMAHGGKHGPPVSAGKLKESLLWKRVSQDEMPPEKPLQEVEKAIIRRWIEEGAAGLPRILKAPRSAEGSDHWAFRPPVRPPLPEVARPELVRTDVDRFIESALEKRGLCLGPEADRALLLRRVAFDLTGLPPSPNEIAAFLADPAPNAYERMVERYLASPHYGERWGRHWLDAAGYAESNGYFSADSDRPLAYRYRDYVIKAFNDDKPFDRFVEEQLAGDELAGYDPEKDVTPEMAEPLIATHFLRNAQDGTGESDGNDLEVLTDKLSVLDGTVQIVSSSLLGLTLQCAKCHDHKFDPISQAEYYQLQAVFTAAYCVSQWIKPAERVVVLGTRAEREENQRQNQKIDLEIDSLRSSLKGFAAPLRRQVLLEKASKLEEPAGSELKKALETAEKERSQAQKELLEREEKLLPDDDLAKRFEEFQKFRATTQSSIAEREKQRPRPLEKVSSLVDTRPDPPPHHLLERGSPAQPGEEVGPGVPRVLCTSRNLYPPEPAHRGNLSSGRRLALARWITSQENPLLARVTVNRLWQQHFGMGLVATPDNFGLSGSPPSHPELLDHLATELVEARWSLKALHRLILKSAAYRQSSGLRPDAARLDPENRLLWRVAPRRLEAESVRDAMLFISGELDRRMGGPYVPTQHGDDGQVMVDEKQSGALRRSIYLQQRRTQPLTFLEVFDSPLIVTACPRRSVSTTPLQSLALLNSDFAQGRSRALEKRLERLAGDGMNDRLAMAFLLVFGRGPTEEEMGLAARFLESEEKEYPSNARGEAWTDLCQMLFASNAFLYVD